MGKRKLTLDLKSQEDEEVIDFFLKLNRTDVIKFIEIGSGLCRFVDKLQSKVNNIEITCVELNKDLAALASKKNFIVLNEDFLNSNIKILSNTYDIVHCSHVIEHFGYPSVINVIDELLRITKVGGFCIIRSPLMWEQFYFDIDHFRPYPPQAIINYLTNPQQQRKGTINISVEKLWYRTLPRKIKKIDERSLLNGTGIIKKTINALINLINEWFKILWTNNGFPCTQPNGYILILRKIN